MGRNDKEAIPDHRRRARPSLSRRLLGLIGIGLVATTALIGWYSERVLESAMLSQAKSQALVFLVGVEREIQLLDRLEPANLQEILSRAARYDTDELQFAILAIYFYDKDGRILAHEPQGQFKSRPLDGRYGEVLRTGKPYLGADVDQEKDPVTGHYVASTDVIMPVHRNGTVVGGVEVELDLGRTVDLIAALANRYEDDLFLMVVGAGGLLLGFVWLVVYRGLVWPVQKLGLITHRIADGDLSARVDRTAHDEIGYLGDSIDRMADSIEKLFREQEEVYVGSLQSLAKALEAKDAYTASHSGRVSHFSVQLGKRISLDAEQLRLLKQGALMHDLGKIGIPDAILNKPGPLTDHEYEVMQSHPELTYSIMRPLKRFAAFAEIARWHHERWDGKGYPDGLVGEAIPLLARIVAIADTWDAMTGDRVYRRGMSTDEALDILRAEQNSGQWDPLLLGQFIDMIHSEQNRREQWHGVAVEEGA